MPLPLYGSGGRTMRILAACSPTICLSIPLTLTRVFASDGRDKDESLVEALRLVDDSFGFNKLLGSGRQNWAVRTMAAKGEITLTKNRADDELVY